ncbi:hypothetical protein AWB94_12495 [Mycolicibacterium canariasense]|nr:hypothetical protein AWB94_12495 [Mycolicibacterium canariasense]
MGITGVLAMGIGTGVASADPYWGPPGPHGPGWGRGPGPADWHHPEWVGWNDGYPAPGWRPPEGWEPPVDWNNPGGWAPPADFRLFMIEGVERSAAVGL